jgi:O-antigen ligase
LVEVLTLEFNRSGIAEKSKKAISILIFMLPFFFLFGVHVVFFHITNLGYLTLLRIYIAAILILAAVYFTANKKIRLGLGRSVWYAAFFAVMIAYAAVSLIWVKDFDDSFFKFSYQIVGAAAACSIAAVIGSKNDLHIFMRVLTVCYTAVLILGIIEIYTGIYLFSPSEFAYSLKDSFGFNFPYSVFYNTNDHETFITLFAPFAIYTTAEWIKGIKGKIACVLLAAMMFFNLFCGRARNCFITTICFLLVLIVICLAVKKLRKFAGTILAVIAAFPVSYLVIICTQFSNGSLIDKVKTISKNDHSIGQRMQMFTGGLRMAADYHFMGVGVGNSVTLMPYYSDLSAINLHNMALQIFVEYGIIIFILYAVMTGLLARDLINARTQKSEELLFCVLCFLSVLAFQVIGMQPSDAMHIYAVWMIFGILFATVKIFYREKTRFSDILPSFITRI